MLARRHFAIALVLPFVAPIVARADNVDYKEEDGVTYRITKQTVQRPMSETHYEDRPQTVYAEQYQTQYLPSQRTTMVPVWEWVNEPYWVNRYNPLAGLILLTARCLASIGRRTLTPCRFPSCSGKSYRRQRR